MGSKSQEKRQAVMTGANKNPGQPSWKEHQQKETQPKDNEDRDQENEEKKGKIVKVKLLTSYRDVGVSGDIVAFDEEKAEELVRLKRAEYVKKSKPADEDKEDEFETGGKDE